MDGRDTHVVRKEHLKSGRSIGRTIKRKRARKRRVIVSFLVGFHPEDKVQESRHINAGEPGRNVHLGNIVAKEGSY